MGDDIARLESLLGVMGTAQSSSGHPLNLLSYDFIVPDARLELAVLGRVGVLGESLDTSGRREAGVAVNEGIVLPSRASFAGGLRSEKAFRSNEGLVKFR